jgi:hypothetical protein
MYTSPMCALLPGAHASGVSVSSCAYVLAEVGPEWLADMVRFSVCSGQVAPGYDLLSAQRPCRRRIRLVQTDASGRMGSAAT